jgi:hypothetical protein
VLIWLQRKGMQDDEEPVSRHCRSPRHPLRRTSPFGRAPSIWETSFRASHVRPPGTTSGPRLFIQSRPCLSTCYRSMQCSHQLAVPPVAIPDFRKKILEALVERSAGDCVMARPRGLCLDDKSRRCGIPRYPKMYSQSRSASTQSSPMQ